MLTRNAITDSLHIYTSQTVLGGMVMVLECIVAVVVVGGGGGVSGGDGGGGLRGC